MSNNPAIIWGTRSINWSQLDQLCATVIGQLKALGIKAGDRIAICAPTCPEYLIVVFGLWRMKAVVCPVSPRLPGLIFNDYLSRIRVKLVLTTPVIRKNFPAVPIRTLHLNEVVCFDARRDPGEVQKHWDSDLEQEATVIATSGSTGEPKPAVHSWGNHYYSALGSHETIPLTSQDRWLLALPLYHVSGMAIIVRCFIAGASIVLASAEDDWAGDIIKRKATHVSLVSTQALRLMQTSEGRLALQTLQYVLLGGSSMPPALIEEMKLLGVNIYTSYGLTEMASQVATGKAGQCVQVLKYRQLKIAEDGQVLLRGETLFKGYVKAGHLHLPLTTDGWFQTGDLGSVDGNGCLSILGRKDYMFISGGENIHPEEIEKVLLSHQGVSQVVVVPIKDKEFGQRPVAFVSFSKVPIATEILIKHCQQFLPAFKIPVDFKPFPKDLPQTCLKVPRKDLQGRIL